MAHPGRAPTPDGGGDGPGPAADTAPEQRPWGDGLPATAWAEIVQRLEGGAAGRGARRRGPGAPGALPAVRRCCRGWRAAADPHVGGLRVPGWGAGDLTTASEHAFYVAMFRQMAAASDVTIKPGRGAGGLRCGVDLPYGGRQRLRRLLEDTVGTRLPPSRLRVLDLSPVADAVADSVLAACPAFPRLRKLDLSHCAELSDRGLAHACRARHLEDLVIRGCRGLTDEGLRPLQALVRLERLHLGGCGFLGHGFRFLAGLPALKEVNLWESRVGMPGIRHLASLPRVESLDLGYNSHMSDEVLVALKGLHLRRLVVNGASFAARSTLADALTDAGLLAVALAPAMRGLTYLDASFCDGITDLSLEAIGAHLRRLCVLKLACCTSGVTDAGVAALTSLEELEELDLSGLARLTPRSLGHLAELPGLKRWALPRQLENGVNLLREE